MEIIVGKTAGFCYGVKRAVEGCYKALEKEKNVYCLGEIVHNENVIKKLEKNGLKFIENIKESNGTTIIRAHGIKREIYEYADQNHINIVDLTCPNVLRIHDIASNYAKKGYYILLCGSKTHPETMGTLSYCGKNVELLEEEKDVLEAIENLKKSTIKKVLLISQTTYSLEKFKNIEKILKEKLDNYKLEVNNTICLATKTRQEETKKISSQVEYMIIIGGKNSSNTKKLYEIAKKECKNCIMIQDKKEVDAKEVLKYEKIGIMAGASTPEKNIEEVVNIIKISDKK